VTEWDEYVEALRTLGRAPAVRDERTRRIDEQEAATKRQADEERDRVDAAAAELDRRLAAVSAEAERALSESGMSATGPAAEVTLPTAASIEGAAAVVTRVEQQLVADTAALAESRALRQTARARRRRLVAMVVLAVAAVILGAVLSAVV
jgi:hypothetical protein